MPWKGSLAAQRNVAQEWPPFWRAFPISAAILALLRAKIPDESSAQNASHPWDDAALVQLRKELLRFAILQLRNRDLAEDAVQEALAAAVAASDRFEKRASLKTWVFAILKNKIIDILRDRWNKNREELADVADESDFDVLFKTNDR